MIAKLSFFSTQENSSYFIAALAFALLFQTFKKSFFFFRKLKINRLAKILMTCF